LEILTDEKLAAEQQASLQRQAAMEAEDTLSFDEFLSKVNGGN
jgi:glutamate--cysteine ligase